MIWFDGELTSSARIDATSAGALLGWGVFTTLAIRGGAPVLWAHHAARLQRDAAAARVELPFDAEQLRAGLMQLIQAENIGDGLARISGTQRGDGRWNDEASAHWSIIGAPAVAASSAPLQLEVSPFRVAARAPLAGVKTTAYLPYFIAWNEARARGFDEALLLTERGWICESARASVFWVKNGALYTPSLDCGCLRGVGREWIIERGRPQQERWFLPELLAADECFLVSGATGVRAVGSLAHRKQTRDWGATGEVTAEFARLWEWMAEDGG